MLSDNSVWRVRFPSATANRRNPDATEVVDSPRDEQ